MALSKKIDVYLDCVSFFSYFGYLHLARNKDLLASHGVEYEIHPFFLGGVNVGSGNKPPWTLPAKARYSNFDSERAKRYFKTPDMKRPDVFPILSIMPQRAMCYVKETFPRGVYEAAFGELWVGLWEQNLDISKPEHLSTVLSRHFSTEEVRVILKAATQQKWKDKLSKNTEQALAQGAFGAPWFWVRNGDVEEPFFGSDRWHFMWDFSKLPHLDFTVLEHGDGRTSKI